MILVNIFTALCLSALVGLGGYSAAHLAGITITREHVTEVLGALCIFGVMGLILLIS